MRGAAPHPQQLVGGGLVRFPGQSVLLPGAVLGADRLQVGLGVGHRRAGKANHVQGLGRFFGYRLPGGGLAGKRGRNQAVVHGDPQHGEGCLSHLPGVGELRDPGQQWRSVPEGVGCGSAHEVGRPPGGESAGRRQETSGHELGQVGLGFQGGDRSLIQVVEDGSGAGIVDQSPVFLASVFEGEEQQHGQFSSGPIEGRQQVDRLVGDGCGAGGFLPEQAEPVPRDGPFLLEPAGEEMHHFVKSGRHRHFFGGDRSAALVGVLKETGIAHHLAGDAVGVGTQPDPEFGIARKGAGEPGDGGRYPLVAADHVFYGGLLRGEEPLKNCGWACWHNGHFIPHRIIYNSRVGMTHYRLSTLGNGLRLITEEMPALRSVSVGCWVDTGARDERANEAGASHFLEHLLFKGTEELSARQIAEMFDGMGAESNAFTSKEQTCYWARLLDDDLPVGMRLLSEMLQRPAFRQNEIDSERQVVFEEINMREDDPQDSAFEAFSRTVHDGHVLGRPVLGTRESIGAMTRADLEGYWRRRYGPHSVVVALAGAVRHSEARELIEELFGQWSGGEVGHSFSSNSPSASVELVERDTEQAHLVLGGAGMDRADERRWAFGILNLVLGGGMSSRLFTSIREERGLAYFHLQLQPLLCGLGCVGYLCGYHPRADRRGDGTHRQSTLQVDG